MAALYAAIDSASISGAVTRVPLYNCICQFSLPRAVVRCMTFSVSSRYSTYGNFCYVTVGKPTFTKFYLLLIFLVQFLFEEGDEITILPSTCAIVL